MRGYSQPSPPNPPPGIVVLRCGAWVAWVLPFGARLMQLWWWAAPEGPRPLTLGFADPQTYRRDRMAIGAVCGRYANRIDAGRLQRGDQTWQLDRNHPLGHCIHGGAAGLGVRDWHIEQANARSVTLVHFSPDGDQGFPGACSVQVRYSLDEHGLTWEATAELSAPCPINLLQHSYWNLDAEATIENHVLQVNATRYLPTDQRELPLPPASVANSCFDFRTATRLCPDHFSRLDGALVLPANPARAVRRVARLSVKDLAVEVRTDRPLLHLYAGAALLPIGAPLGVAHGPGAGLCLETEDWPNGPALGHDVWYGPERAYRHTLRLDFDQMP